MYTQVLWPQILFSFFVLIPGEYSFFKDSISEQEDKAGISPEGLIWL